MYEDFFAERLASLRQQKNVSAREMSLAIGQNSSYINRIENKHTFPSMQTFFYICEYLEITPQEFFDGQNGHPADLKRLIELLNKLQPEQLNTLSKLVADLVKNKS